MDLNSNQVLLGTVGWNRPDWAAVYYPSGLPADWRLAYFANDCDGVLLAAGDRGAELGAALDELDTDLEFFVAAAAAQRPAIARLLGDLHGRSVNLLADDPAAGVGDAPLWLRQADGSWVEPATGRRAVCWNLAGFDLRALRGRAAVLPADTAALFIDGPGAVPAHCRDLRVLLQLLRGG